MEKSKNLIKSLLLDIALAIKNLLLLRAVALVLMFGICLLACVLIYPLMGLVGNVIISLVCGVFARSALSDKKGTTLKRRVQFFSFLIILEGATFLYLAVCSSDAKLSGPTFIIIGLIISAICFLIGWLFDKMMSWFFS